MLRLGVDVGGTNTDAVLLDIAQGHVLASAKRPTTPDVTLGIQNATQSVIDQVPHAADIQAIAIGTTVGYLQPISCNSTPTSTL